MKYMFDIYGRPKNEKVDELFKGWNDSFHAMGGEGNIHYNGYLTTLTIDTKEGELSKNEREQILTTAKELFEEKFSDIEIKEHKA